MFYLCSHGTCPESPPQSRPSSTANLLAASPRGFGVPRHVLLELADSEARAEAASALGEIIVAEMTMAYPEFVESVEPPLPF